ncbi:MAG: hypothetical protein ACLFRV_09405 [Acidimicrobiales bacterium]
MTPPPEPDSEPPDLSGHTGARQLRFLLWVVPLLLLSAGAIVWILAGDGGSRPSETIEIIVPAGTQDRLAAGEEVVVMPARLEFRVGDRIRIRNDDDVAQSVGPYVVDPGKEMLLEYGAPGVYEGYCPLSEGERYEIVVTE